MLWNGSMQRSNWDLSLERLKDFVLKNDFVEVNLPNVVHVAGTNGKGSTTAFLGAILKEHGYSVNTFTSPHLVKFNERIRINEIDISDEELENTYKKLQKLPYFDKLTMFEQLTIVAYYSFYHSKSDFNIIEVGLGGRLDATNILPSKILSIISKISIDHSEFLGKTVPQIAKEKAGIITENGTCISSYQTDEAKEVIEQVCKNLHTKLIAFGKDWQIQNEKLLYNGMQIDLKNKSLLGFHQFYNASTAIVAACNILKNPEVSKIEHAIQNTKWAGRLQKLQGLLYEKKIKQNIYVDGAHNHDALKEVFNFVSNNFENNVLIFGLLKRKCLEMVFNGLQIPKAQIYTYTVKEDEAYDAEEISEFLLKEKGVQSIPISSLKEIISSIDEGKNIFILGSLYLVGEVLSHYKGD